MLCTAARVIVRKCCRGVVWLFCALWPWERVWSACRSLVWCSTPFDVIPCHATAMLLVCSVGAPAREHSIRSELVECSLTDAQFFLTGIIPPQRLKSLWMQEVPDNGLCGGGAPRILMWVVARGP